MKKYSWYSILFGIIFLLWFFASLGGLMYVISHELVIGPLTMIIGQYFIVFGIIGLVSIKERSSKSVAILLDIVGLILMVSGAIEQFGTEYMKTYAHGCYPYMATVSFAIMGIYLLSLWIANTRLKNRCTETVMAACIGVDTIRSGERVLFKPTWMACYKGKDRVFSDNLYVNIRYEEGNVEELYVNPANPKEFYYRGKRLAIEVLIILGIACIISGVASTILLLARDGIIELSLF